MPYGQIKSLLSEIVRLREEGDRAWPTGQCHTEAADDGNTVQSHSCKSMDGEKPCSGSVTEEDPAAHCLCRGTHPAVLCELGQFSGLHTFFSRKRQISREMQLKILK